MTTIIHIPQTLKRQHEDGREYKSPFLRQRRLWTTTPLQALEKKYYLVDDEKCDSSLYNIIFKIDNKRYGIKNCQFLNNFVYGRSLLQAMSRKKRKWFFWLTTTNVLAHCTTRFFFFALWLCSIKGQLISKANFLVLIWTKTRTKLLFDFCPSL